MCVKCLNDWCEDTEDCPNPPYDPTEEKMCKHGDLSCDCYCDKPKTEPTKFEVGKMYRYKSKDSVPVTCVWSGEYNAVLKYTSNNSECWWEHRSIVHWQEYVEPPKLYFKDLKPGDKFKWVNPWTLSTDVALKLNGYYTYISTWETWCADGSTKNLEVTRVE